MFELKLEKRTSEFGDTARAELYAIEQILFTIVKQFALGSGVPPGGNNDGVRAIYDGSGNRIGEYKFCGDSLHAPNAKQPVQHSDKQKRLVLPYASRIAS